MSHTNPLGEVQLPSNIRDELQHAFDLFDKNHDGFISTEELHAVFQSLGHNPSEEEVQQMMSEVDTDNNGLIDFSEFITMMSQSIGEHDEEAELLETFRVFDQNGDGKISRDELKHAMANLGQMPTEHELTEMIKSADLNKDGYIDFEEFRQLMTRFG